MPPKPVIAPGRLHKTKDFAIPGLPEKLPLTLYLPPDYDSSTRRYPVAYIFDGQNLFTDAGSFAGGWRLNEALDWRHAAGLPVPVVVGIHHGVDRQHELTPWPVDDGAPAFGDTLLRWVTSSLAEMVAEDVRIEADPKQTLIGGSSLGGLLALYGFFKYPLHFGRGLVMSPSLWVGGGTIFEHVARAPYGGDPRLYLDCGAYEAEGIVIEHAEWMADLLERKGFYEGYHFMWRPDVCGDHNEYAWRRRAPRALRFLYDT